MLKGMPFRLKDYLELVDWTGRAILENKRGYIPVHQPPILERLHIEPKHWLYITQNFESRFKGLVGACQLCAESDLSKIRVSANAQSGGRNYSCSVSIILFFTLVGSGSAQYPVGYPLTGAALS
jgi:hypothetical protein